MHPAHPAVQQTRLTAPQIIVSNLQALAVTREFECRECGKPCDLDLSVFSVDGTRFCSDECFEDYTAGMQGYVLREAAAASERYRNLSPDSRKQIKNWEIWVSGQEKKAEATPPAQPATTRKPVFGTGTIDRSLCPLCGETMPTQTVNGHLMYICAEPGCIMRRPA